MHKDLLQSIENRNIPKAISIIKNLSSEELGTTDYFGSTIFHYAVKYSTNSKNEQIFDVLLEVMSVNALCNKSNDFGGKTVLHMLAEAGFSQSCIKFIDKVGKKGVQITDGRVTALHYAAKSGLGEVCKKIIPMLTRQELEYKDLYGNLALHFIVKSELNDVAISLIQQMSRAAIECYNDDHYIALQYAAKLGKLDICIELVKQMSQNGIEFKSPYGKTDPALSMAAYEKHVEIVTLLAKHMSIPAIKNCEYKGKNILEFVKSNSHSEKDRKIAEIIEARIEGKDIDLICDVNLLSKSQQLVLLIKADNTEKAIDLITRMKPGELKEADKDGRTILHWIAEKNNTKLMNIALKKQPDLVEVKDDYENLPITLAEIYSSESCMNILKNFGSALHNETSLGGVISDFWS